MRKKKITMGCLVSKKKKKVLAVYNRVWDLMDGDGNERVDRDEISAIASVVQQYQVEQCTAELERLKARDPAEYVLSIVGKPDQPTTTLSQERLYQACTVLAVHQVARRSAPVARKREIQRLIDIEKGTL